MSEWRLLDAAYTAGFIDAVKDKAFADLFNGSAYELWAKDLEFFNGYAHYQLCNMAMIPYFTLDYISNGENHFFLDGSEHALEMLIQHDALLLSADNVMDYISFHSDVTFYPDRKVKFITDPDHAPYSGASAMAQHFKIQKYKAGFEIEENAADACFYITMPVLYNEETIEGRVQVMMSGQINILSPVRIPLMDQTREHVPLDYDHPHEDKIIAASLEVLEQSETGKKLVEYYNNNKLKLRIISACEHAVLLTKSGAMFVLVPENVTAYSPYQAIDIAGIIKDKELSKIYERPDPLADQSEYYHANAAYNLEIVIELCKIAQEFENSDFSEVTKTFRKDGYEKFYSAYKNNADKAVLAELMLDTIFNEN